VDCLYTLLRELDRADERGHHSVSFGSSCESCPRPAIVSG
jgi:hypothetical protein